MINDSDKTSAKTKFCKLKLKNVLLCSYKINSNRLYFCLSRIHAYFHIVCIPHKTENSKMPTTLNGYKYSFLHYAQSFFLFANKPNWLRNLCRIPAHFCRAEKNCIQINFFLILTIRIKIYTSKINLLRYARNFLFNTKHDLWKTPCKICSPCGFSVQINVLPNAPIGSKTISERELRLGFGTARPVAESFTEEEEEEGGETRTHAVVKTAKPI